MEVKLQYVVGIEDIPDEVLRLTPDTEAGDLHSSIVEAKALVSQRLIPEAIEHLQTIKKEMYLINRRILDIEGILRGYDSVQNQDQEVVFPEGMIETEDTLQTEVEEE